MAKFLILDSQLRNFAFYDLNEACRAIQNIMGVTDGGVSSIVFSGFDWENETIENRVDQLRHYIKVQEQYLD